MTPIKGIGPHSASPFAHGVVLGGGAQAVCHAQPRSFSLPQVEPRKIVPGAHTLALGAAPHSDSAH